MINALARRIHADTSKALTRLLLIAIPTAILWYVARHIAYWIFSGLFGIEGQHVPPESRIIVGETYTAGIAAYAIASIVMEMSLLSSLINKIGADESVSPTLLTVMIPGPILGFFLILGFVPALAVLPLYVAYHVVLLAARLVGSKPALERWMAARTQRQLANVVDLTAGTSWAGRPRPIA